MSNTKEVEEYHANGQLKYKETIKVIPFEDAHKYDGLRTHPDGYYWIRIGKQVKLHDNGQKAWELNYDKMGNVLKEKNTQYRKDGSAVVY